MLVTSALVIARLGLPKWEDYRREPPHPASGIRVLKDILVVGDAARITIKS